METVFSYPSKLGYRVMVFHICVEHPDISVACVSERVKEGRHPVSEEKIRRRYDRNGPLIRQAALLSDIAHIFDNSKLNQPPERVMSFMASNVSFSITMLPDWILKIYAEDLGDR